MQKKLLNSTLAQAARRRVAATGAEEMTVTNKRLARAEKTISQILAEQRRKEQCK